MLRAESETGDPVAMRQLRLLIKDSRERFQHGRSASYMDPFRLDYPDSWNVLVARYLRNPYLGDFVQSGDPVLSEMGLRAAAVLVSNDEVEIKLLLAHCHANSPKGAQQVIGWVHYAKLLDLAEAHNRRLGLVEEPAAAETE